MSKRIDVIYVLVLAVSGIAASLIVYMTVLYFVVYGKG